MKLIGLLFAVVLGSSTSMTAAPEVADAVDPANSTWHLGLDALWGSGKKNSSRSLDIYPVFRDGKWTNALATARNYNGSIHFIESNSVSFDPATGRFSGDIEVLVTPDGWVPANDKPYTLTASIDGELGKDGKISGQYTATRPDGNEIFEGKKSVEGKLIGGASPTETGWSDSVWSAEMFQILEPGEIDRDMVVLTVGIADGKVNWGTVGLIPQARMDAARHAPVEVDGLTVDAESGEVSGDVIVSGRHLHPGGDLDERYKLAVKMQRVQGLVGGKAEISMLKDGEEQGTTRFAAGRGSVIKGGGSGSGPIEEVLWRYSIDNRPWWIPVPDYKPVAPGEHPRLLFRKSDVDAIRERAGTEEGKLIVERLRTLLGRDGEAVTDQFNTVPPHNHEKSPELPPGTFTSWHAAGFGLLYQITGDPKYAELSRKCVELMFDGKMDIDNRYAWFKPGTDLRSSSVLSAVAYAYDMCYDAWPEDFRKKVALEIQNFDKVTATSEADARDGKKPDTTNISDLAGRTGYPPGSNHYGSLIGGSGVALLAINGDPGVDNAFVEARLAEIESNIPRMLELGFGDAGFYAEGIPGSRLSSNGGLVELLIALRTAAGRDYIDGPRENAAWLTLRWIMQLAGEGFANFPNRGIYGGDGMYGRGDMLSASGDFAFGFGAIPTKYRRALLWAHETFVEKGEATNWQPAGKAKFNANKYPHRAIGSLLFWPIGEDSKNPAEVMPLTAVDTIHGYVMARNRWQDSDDIIVTHLLDYGPDGYYEVADGRRWTDRPGVLRIWGHGLRTHLSTATAGGEPIAFAKAKDGSFSLTSRGKHGPTGVAVDFSKASGADAVVVAVGPGAMDPKAGDKDKPEQNAKASTKYHRLKLADGTPVYVMTLQTGAAPDVKIEGNQVSVGGQTFVWGGRTLTIANFEALPGDTE